jgi:hypothetical protein
MLDQFDWPGFAARTKKLIAYISAATRTPINSELWEEVIFHALRSMGEKYKGESPKWISGSHAAGADIWTDKFGISAKGGTLKKETVKISSYRLTSHDTLEEMIAFIDGPGKNFDFYLCCAKKKDTATERTYNVLLVPADVFAAKELKWHETFSKKDGKQNGWKGVNEQGVIVGIHRKMSNQLWIELPLSMCQSLAQITIPKAELGKSLEAILD